MTFLNALRLLLFISCIYIAQETELVYLSGLDSDSPVDWEFKVSKGRKADVWSVIPVPSNWELQGFGEYNYGHDKNKSDEIGHYKYTFNADETWKGKNILIVFEGVMTDTEVRLNSELAGKPHQGGFYRFQYNITDLLRFGQDNILEVFVKKVSENKSIETAERKSDYWVFGGIYRPVYLKILPAQHIIRTAINAEADGNFQMNVYLSTGSKNNVLEARIIDDRGYLVGEKMNNKVGKHDDKITLSTKLSDHENWTAESPVLYYVDVALIDNKNVIHSIRERFGFRTIEVREGNGIFLNSKPITLKGCNRHSFYPTTGRAVSRNKCYEDLMLLKEMNMNAVRMSHYPPDAYFLDLCDEYGIYVLNELAGWQKPPYDTPTSRRLIKQMIARDINHPSVLFWDNGNEGGWNTETDNEFSKHDPQNRTVLHPWELFNGIDTDHYEDYQSVSAKMKAGNIFMPTEHLHGLYDGGHGAGLDDFWKLMWGNPLTGGMFLWVFADEGVVRTDREWKIDTDGNHAPDGILGPFREKEGSFYTIKEIWSPIYIETKSFAEFRLNDKIPLENRYDFTNLKDCSFRWQLIKYAGPSDQLKKNEVIDCGYIKGPDLKPGEKGFLDLNIPSKKIEADALFLTAVDNFNRDVFTWKWKVIKNSEIISKLFTSDNGKVEIIEDEEFITAQLENGKYSFDKKNGMLVKVQNGFKEIPFKDGPLFVSNPEHELYGNQRPEYTIGKIKDGVKIDIKNHSRFDKFCWTVKNNGWLILDYKYSFYDSVKYMGISFSYPEKRMHQMTWLGKGPYRVWKNRTKGQTIDVWNKNYKNYQVNTEWEYPEFPGYYDDFSWIVFSTEDGPITILSETEDLFLRVYSQKDGQEPRHTEMIWPDGDISFLHAIPAIGTKFHEAKNLGPSSRDFKADGSYNGRLFFYFGVP